MHKKVFHALSLALIFVLLVTTVVVADIVRNNVVADGKGTIYAGQSTIIKYWIEENSSGGFQGCDAADGTSATVTIVHDSLVEVNPSSLTFTACDDKIPVNFSSNNPGNYEITVVVSDDRGSYNVNNAKFTLKVLTAQPPSDTTPPVITPSISGTPGKNGWYVSDVIVNWTVDDDESAVSSTTGCDATTIDYDTGGVTLTCSATSAGGTASESVTIKRDATAPTIFGSVAPAPNAAGWNNTDVTVSFNCGDNLSGVASCGPDETLSTEGAAQSVTGTAYDFAGNTDSATVSGINIDKTAPVVSVTGVEDGAQYKLGSVPEAGCATSDALSGVKTEASLSVTGGVVGSFTATCSGAEDNAGNPGYASVSYSVVYDFNGFFRPVDNLPALNKAKAGSAIPLKFSLNGDQGLGILAAGYPKSVMAACQFTATIEPIEETWTAGSSSLQYDAAADQYVYVWKTDKSWTGCRVLEVKLIDGTSHFAYFQFTK